MAKYKYIGNRNPVDGTAAIITGSGTVDLGGDIELAEAEYESLSVKFVFEPLEVEAAPLPPVAEPEVVHGSGSSEGKRRFEGLFKKTT